MLVQEEDGEGHQPIIPGGSWKVEREKTKKQETVRSSTVNSLKISLDKNNN